MASYHKMVKIVVFADKAATDHKSCYLFCNHTDIEYIVYSLPIAFCHVTVGWGVPAPSQGNLLAVSTSVDVSAGLTTQYG